MLNFLQKIADISKLKKVVALKGQFSEIDICVYLPTKFQISSIILTSFIDRE